MTKSIGFFTFLTLFLVNLTHAEITHHQKFRYQEFHDPGWMSLVGADGDEITAYFHYSLITYEDISSWEPGESITVILDTSKGVVLQRDSSKVHYNVIFDQDSNPITKRLNECLNGDRLNTYIIAECHNEVGSYYQTTAQNVHSFLTSYGSEKLAKALEVEQQSWVLYQEMRDSAIREYLSDKSGTIHIILNANDYHMQMKSRLESLSRFLE